jgi:hypothetical protein
MERFQVIAHNDRGLTLGTINITTLSEYDARREGWLKFPYADRVRVDRLPDTSDPICPRCGALRTACGGPTDPHE